MDQEQLTQRPICPNCKENQLTNEEVAMYKNGKGNCWYCVVDTLVQMNMADTIPDPRQYGRDGETIESGIQRSKTKFFRPPIDQQALQQGTPPAPGKAVPAISGQPVGSQLQLNDADRTDFAKNFGVDPLPKMRPTEIVVHGANEDTYMKFSIPLPLDSKEEKEIKRIMDGMLNIFGKLLKFGPQFASTLIELENINPEMFLGGRK